MFCTTNSALQVALAGLCSVACNTSFTPVSGTGGAFATPAATTGAPQSQGAVPGAGATPGVGSPGMGGVVGSAGVTSGAGGTTTVSAGGTPIGEGAGGTISSPMGGSGGTPAPGAGGSIPSMGGAPPMTQACPATVLAPGTTNAMVQIGGVTRNYILHVPPGYTGKTPVPLVTDWHGILFNASYEQTFSSYQAKSDKEGFIVAWPNGIDNAWNIGDCCTTSRSVDDVGFARGLVAQIAQTACIDLKRVYAVGWSMGGGMSYKLACDATDLVAAISPSAFELEVDSEGPCRPSRPISVISFNSTGDPIVPYAGGNTHPPNGLNVTVDFMGAVGTFQKWAQLNGCKDMPADKGSGCQTYSQCNAGVEVTLCTKQGGGHDPGDPEVAWETLKRFSLP